MKLSRQFTAPKFNTSAFNTQAWSSFYLLVINVRCSNIMPTAMSYFAVGSSVVLQNLVNASKYNGLRGTVQSVIDTKTLRQNVLVNGVQLSVKPANMKMFNDVF